MGGWSRLDSIPHSVYADLTRHIFSDIIHQEMMSSYWIRYEFQIESDMKPQNTTFSYRIGYDMPIVQTPADIGSSIRAARKARGLTQAALAGLAQVHQPKISEIEQGKPNAQLGLVLRVIAALDLSISIGAEPSHGGPEVKAVQPTTIVDEPLPDASIDIDAIVDKRRR